jgi:opacity protein-like surface antigen
MCHRITSLIKTVTVLCLALVTPSNTQAAEPFPRWIGWFDMGAVIPEDIQLTEAPDPIIGDTMTLDPGFQMDFGFGYRPTRWLLLGPELGFTINNVDTIGDWSYKGTYLSQILLTANVRLEYPTTGPVLPFLGAGIGGSGGFLTFHGDNYDYNDEPDGTASDFSLAFQAFAGLQLRLSDSIDLGLIYRYTAVSSQEWDVDWWNGDEFTIGVDSVRMHSICVMLSAKL